MSYIWTIISIYYNKITDPKPWGPVISGMPPFLGVMLYQTRQLRTHYVHILKTLWSLWVEHTDVVSEWALHLKPTLTFS
jgi:hypothetical protein